MGPDDWIVPQYREPGAALVRGMPLKELICQLIGNAEDPIHGRQMPCHYAYRKGNYVSISSPVGTQLPHAVGIGLAMKLRGAKAAVLVFFGDGGTSTGDFHVAMNFAGVFRTPTVFLLNNNQWAISLPVARQTAATTLAEKAIAYGFDGVRVDGMDALAVYRATRDAATTAHQGGGPTLVEAVTYRLGPHSSSDDPSRYRDEAEVAIWRARDPIARFRRYLEHARLWDETREAALEQEIGDEITRAVQEAERAPPPPVDTLFSDVFAVTSAQLAAQRDSLTALPRR
jgi:pyruvate dehydrogenase E1 component alpha subunit